MVHRTKHKTAIGGCTMKRALPLSKDTTFFSRNKHECPQGGGVRGIQAATHTDGVYMKSRRVTIETCRSRKRKTTNVKPACVCKKNKHFDLYQARSQMFLGRTCIHISTACVLDISPLDRSARASRRGAPKPPYPLPPSAGPPAFLLIGQIEPHHDGRASHGHLIAVGQGARLQR